VSNIRTPGQAVSGGRLERARTAAEAAREPVNGWLHLGGAILALAGLVVLGAQAAGRGTIRHLVGAGVFGLTAVLMFGASSLYHLRRTSRRGPVYRRLDHAAIYAFIAGSYTPVCLIALHDTPYGTPLLAGIWSLAALGIAQKFLWRDAPRGVSTALYLALGWLGMLVAPPLLRVAPGFFTWMLAGGILYTVGAVCYSAKWPRGRPGVFGFHELWHLFVLCASASHYWGVLAYLVPLT
jgi:hemolysin III